MRVFYYSLFYPCLLFWKHKDQISDTKLSSQRSPYAHLQPWLLPMSAQSCCVTVSPGRDMTAKHLHFPVYSSSPLGCWKYMFPAGKGSALLIDDCGDEPWLSTGSWLSGLDIPILQDFRNNTQPLLLKHFKTDLQAGTHKLGAPDITFLCTTVKYQNQFTVLEEFSELSEKSLQDGWVTKQGSRTRRATLLKDNNVSPARN